MELDPRRLGLRAQVQIALALLEKDKERRNLCGGSGFDRAVYRSPKAQITYGQLIARTSEAEQKEIIAKYRGASKKKENKGTQKRAGW